MPNLFQYIDDIGGAGGHEGLLEAGQPVMARTVRGYEPLGNPLDEDMLVGALTSVLTSEQQVDLAVGNLIEFPVERPSGRWQVLIESRVDGVRVRMRGPSPDAGSQKPRPASATPAIDLDVPDETNRSLHEGRLSDSSQETSAEPEQGDPFDDLVSSDDESSTSGVYEQPQWEEMEASAETTGHAGEAPDAGLAATAASDDIVPGAAAQVGQDAAPSLERSEMLDPFAMDDDLDDEFDIEDPFAEIAPVTRTDGALAAVQTDDDLADAAAEYSPFDFGDEPEGAASDVDGAAQGSIDGAAVATEDAARTPKTMDELPRQPEAAGDAQGEAQALTESGLPDEDGVAGAFGAPWAWMSSEEDLGGLLSAIPAGSVVYLLARCQLALDPFEPLVLDDQGDAARFRRESRTAGPDRLLVLDLEDISPWLEWAGRRLEAGHRVVVFTEAPTAEAAWRGFVGLQSMASAEAWFSRHRQYAVLTEGAQLHLGMRVAAT